MVGSLMRLSRALLPTSDTPVQAETSTQELVFDKAAGLFWRKGYAATSTREIAASMGIRQASLYHHVQARSTEPTVCGIARAAPPRGTVRCQVPSDQVDLRAYTQTAYGTFISSVRDGNAAASMALYRSAACELGVSVRTAPTACPL